MLFKSGAETPERPSIPTLLTTIISIDMLLTCKTIIRDTGNIHFSNTLDLLVKK